MQEAEVKTRQSHAPQPFSDRVAAQLRNVSWQDLLFRLRAFIALIVLFIFFWYKLPDVWVKQSNLITLSKHVADNALLGIGMTFVILTGGIDLSVGSIVGVTGMIAGGLIVKGIVVPTMDATIYLHVWVIILLTLIIGALLGALNGVLITRLNVAPFIATLGMLYVARGVALLLNKGQIFPNLHGSADLGNTGFPKLGTGEFLQLPYPTWLMIIFSVIAIFVAAKTPFGRQVYAIGGNERAAELSGVRVKRVKLMTYMISGFFAAMVGLVIASKLTAAHPNAGNTYELNAIAVVVLGGTSLSGGRGTIFGTIIGAFVIGVLTDGLVLLNVDWEWQIVIKGVVIVAAVIADQLQQRWQERAALSQAQAQVQA